MSSGCAYIITVFVHKYTVWKSGKQKINEKYPPAGHVYEYIYKKTKKKYRSLVGRATTLLLGWQVGNVEHAEEFNLYPCDTINLLKKYTTLSEFRYINRGGLVSDTKITRSISDATRDFREAARDLYEDL